MCALPKHAVIFHKLHEAIQLGKYPQGSRLPSEIALARKFGVSRPTVGRALKELERMSLIERHIGAGSFVTKPPSLEKGSLGLIADGLESTEIAEPLAAEIAHAAQAHGWNVLRGTAIGQRGADDIAIEWKKRNVKGVFFAPLEHNPVRSAFNRAIAERLSHHGMSVVLLDRDLADFPERSAYDLVSIDDFFAGLELAAYLTNQGFLKIAFIALPDFPATTDLRLAGVRYQAERINGAEVTFCIGDPTHPTFVRSVLEEHKPDAIICSNDSSAAKLLQSLNQIGENVPLDIRVAGFDDVRYAVLLTPSLTTMRQPCSELGVTAVDTMLSRLNNHHAPPRRVLLRAQLIIRDSTK